MKTAPAISSELVRFLEETYPDKMPMPPLDAEDVAFSAGQVAVVRYLRKLLTEQQKGETEESASFIQV